ncbi:MAG: hypothetical protein ACE5FG_11700 [Myxococcota bacterium]
MSSPLILLLLLATAAAPLVDPTRPPQSRIERVRESSRAATRLSSILIAPGRRIATIDGRLVQEGDWVAGARVVQIEPYAVRLSGPAGELVLQLTGPPAKQELWEEDP